MMKEMSTIKFPNQPEAYEIVDAFARSNIDNKAEAEHTHSVSEILDFAHEHDQRYYTEQETDTKLDELRTLINENADAIDTLKNATPELTQSDWNQNDSTASDYIKNRTHWVEYATTILDSETFECTTLASDSTSYYCAKSGNIGLINERKYNITVNGTVYTASALTAFGTDDVALIADAEECRIYDRSNGTVEVFTDSSRTLTISIATAEDTYIKLDERFIPDVFARSADIDGKMDKENPSGTGAFSINRKNGSVIGENSISIGTDSVASGASSTAIGSETNATGFAAHAEGQGTLASGDNSHAEGQGTKASGKNSHAEGECSEASGENQHVQGKYNLLDENNQFVHIIGNGTYSTRSNAHTLDWEGNAWYAGDIYVGSTSGVNKDSGSKKLIATPSDAVAGDLLIYDGTNWVRISKADLIAEIIAALPNAEEASF